MKHNSPSESSSTGATSGSEAISGGVDSPGGFCGVRGALLCCSLFVPSGFKRSSVNFEGGSKVPRYVLRGRAGRFPRFEFSPRLCPGFWFVVGAEDTASTPD